MAITTAILVALTILVAFVGAIAFLVQGFVMLLSGSHMPVRKDMVYRGVWLLVLSAFMFATLTRISDASGLLCAGLFFPAMTCLGVAVGYFMDKEYNRSLDRQRNKPHD